MNAVREARHLLAMRAHRKVAAQRLEALREECRRSIAVVLKNDSSKAVFGTETDLEVVESLRAAWEDFEPRLGACITRLYLLNARDDGTPAPVQADADSSTAETEAEGPITQTEGGGRERHGG